MSEPLQVIYNLSRHDDWSDIGILLVHIKHKFRTYCSTTVSNQQVEVTLLSTTVQGPLSGH